MAKRNTNYLRLGLFVLLGLLLFTYGVYRISEEQGLFSKGIIVYADFEDVRGLQAGNKVRFAGIHIGSVESISVLSDTVLRVAMEIIPEAGTYLRKNALAEIGTDGLVGNVVVNLSAGEGEAELIEEGDFVARKLKAELPQMLETLAASNYAVEQVSRNLLSITEKMNRGDGGFSLLLNDADFAQTLVAVTQNLEQATQRINAAAGSIEQLTAGVERGEGNIGYLLRDSSLEGQVARLSRELDSLVVYRTAPILDNLETASQELSLAATEARNLFDGLNEGEGLLGVLTTDTTAAEDLQSTLHNLEASMLKVDENLEAMRSSWPFKKYFKKKGKKD